MKEYRSFMEFLNQNLQRSDIDLFPAYVELDNTSWELLKNNTSILNLNEIVRLLLFLLNKKVYPKEIPIKDFLAYFSLYENITSTQIRILKQLFASLIKVDN